MAHHRLFVALRPPPPIRRHLLGRMGGIPGARWQSDDQLHCTLRFIGEVDRHQAEDIAAALGSVRHDSFALQIGEAGTFSRKDRIDTLWIGLAPRHEARALHGKIDRSLALAGLESEHRAYVPHITIARFSPGHAPDPSIVVAMRPAAPLAFEVDAFLLYESRLGTDGATYEAIARYPLR